MVHEHFCFCWDHLFASADLAEAQPEQVGRQLRGLGGDHLELLDGTASYPGGLGHREYSFTGSKELTGILLFCSGRDGLPDIWDTK